LKKLIRRVDSDERPPVPSIARPELAEVIKSCWDKDPTKRMTMKEVVEKLSGVGWNLDEGADAEVTKAFLMRFPVDASSSRSELECRLEAEKSKIGALEVEIARLQQAAVARGAEIASLRAENAGLKAKRPALEPSDVVRVLTEGPALLRSFELPALRPGVVPKKGEVTELHRAAQRGDVAAVLEFAVRPEFINAQNAEGKTPLWWQCCGQLSAQP
jgi:hypothetical protein